MCRVGMGGSRASLGPGTWGGARCGETGRRAWAGGQTMVSNDHILSSLGRHNSASKFAERRSRTRAPPSARFPWESTWAAVSCGPGAWLACFPGLSSQVSGRLRPSSVYEPASRGLSCSSAGPGTSALLSRWWPVRANMMCGALRTHESSQWPPWWELTSPSLCREGTRVTEVSGCQGHAVSRWRGLGLVPVGHRAQPSTARLCLSNERGTPLSSPVPASPPWPSGAQLPLGRLFLN